VDREQQLSEVLRDFARTMATDFRIQGILDHLVRRIVEILPISAAGVTLISPDADPRYVAASDDSALRYEALQSELGEGPCLMAYQTGKAVSVPDLASDLRFPTFRSRALAEGLVGVFTFPLRQDDKQLGALDLYRDTPGSLDAATMAAAQTLADVAAAYLLNARARADLRDSSDRYRESSLHDALTGLPNRVLFGQRLDHAIQRAVRSGKMAAILFVDIDSFKDINDTYGHSVGDQMLKAVGGRLSGLLRPGDSLARLSGDEFVVLCEELNKPSEAERIAARIGTALAAPFVLPDQRVHATASIGIAFAGRATDIPEQLLQDADAAMYQAKRKGGARHQIVDLRETQLARHRAGLAHDLRGALARGELRTNYQPIITTADGSIGGVEALLRWDHPTRGWLMPTTVVPLAEQFGLIADIGLWMLEQACLDQRRWRRVPRRHDFTIAVNVSAQQLMESDFAATVAAVLLETHTDPRLLTLEMTESVFLQDSARALVVLDDLKHLGVNLALDDFGTGYSSLSYLKRFPVDVVKIDQGFVADMGHDAASSAIVAAIVDLAHLLGMTVVAEGVETADQHRAITALGCESWQGYYFARPMSAGEVDELIGPADDDRRLVLPAV
jgi:diguanylate cyclase (GGDEF)-like protein